MFSKIRSSLDNHTALILLFKSMVLPFAEFANVFVISCDQQRKNKIQRLINKGLKLALKRDRRCENKLLHKEVRLASWETRAKLALNKLMFKYKYADEYLEHGTGVTSLHVDTVFKLEKPNSVQYANSVSYMRRKMWNELPSRLRSFDCRNAFNILVKAHYRDQYFGTHAQGFVS